MEKIFTVESAARAVNGELVNCAGCAEKRIGSVSTDTRTIKEDAVFVALKGESNNGHKYVKTAADKGAVCCIVQRGEEMPEGLPCIVTEDTAQALLDLAGAYRRRFDIPVVAVTGSVGKTSTRGMIASVLTQKYKTLATEGNFNNHIPNESRTRDCRFGDGNESFRRACRAYRGGGARYGGYNQCG